jgi:ribosomal protein S18 acetylase RimI-like enzyme
MLVRDFEAKDTAALVEILKANQQYGHPQVDGPEAMIEVQKCLASEFVVAEEESQPVGLIRGVFDGSRAIIYLASVHPNFQRQGIGTALLREITRRFKERGAKAISVTIPGDAAFWKRFGFRQTTRVMSVYPIDEILTHTG